MPACVAHMLIARKVRDRLTAETVPAGFVKMLNENARYMELGSLGPDLPYYAIRGRSPYDLPEEEVATEEIAESRGPTWGDRLHSEKPNLLPLEIIEAIWRGSEGHWSDQDKMTLAFACGYLTHIAADQIVHPFVNSIAGPYYESRKNRHTHREVEVYQDLAVYKTVKGGDLMEDRPNTWCNLNQGNGQETEEWFRLTLRTAFNKVYGFTPGDDDIERWVNHLLGFLEWPKPLAHMYWHAARDYRQNGDDSQMVQKAFIAINYMKDCFEQAVELGSMYVMAAAKFYALDRWDNRYRDAFLRVVSGADLGDPKPEVNLEQVREALSEWPTPL